MGARDDVNLIVEYRQDFHRILTYSLFGLALGIGPLAWGGSDGNAQLAGGALVGLGCLGLLWVLWRIVIPGSPLLKLSAAGMIWHNGSADVSIPWSEVRGVETVSFVSRSRSLRGRPVEQRFEGVTLVVISKAFHDRHVDPGSTFMRGPYWDSFVRPRGDEYGIVLHHGSFGVRPSDVRLPIEARWSAFRDRPAGVPVPAPDGDQRRVKFGGGFRPGSPVQAVKTGAPLLVVVVLLTNIAGIWETGNQREARLRQEELSIRFEESRRQHEQSQIQERERRERFDEGMRQMDERMNQLFGRTRQVSQPPQ